MSRTYKDLPYKVARERFGVREPFLIMGHAERRTHGADVIFYAHEVDAIATFEEHLAKDSRFAFAGATEVVGHLITGRRSYSWTFPRRINGELLEDLADLKRVHVGDVRPKAHDFAEFYEISSKTNVFKVYSLIRVFKGRDAYMDDEKYIPYWGRPRCRCEFCIDPVEILLGSEPFVSCASSPRTSMLALMPMNSTMTFCN